MSMPTNPLYDALKNWQKIATQTVTNIRTRVETMRSTWYQRFRGPAPTARVGPLMRLRAMQGGAGGTMRRVTPATGFVMPHVTDKRENYDFTFKAPSSEHQPYDYTQRGPMQIPPFSTQRRLGMEGEGYDFTF